MKKFFNRIFWILVVVNLTFLGSYYFDHHHTIRALFTSNEEDKITLPNTLKGAISETNDAVGDSSGLFYGDLMNNVVFTSIDDETINLSSQNQHYKYIYINQPINPNAIALMDFEHIINLKKDLKSNHLLYVYLVIGEISDEKRIELVPLQKQTGISIVSMSVENFSRTFKLPDCKCGFDLLLDKNNIVRYSNKSTGYEELKTIIGNELLKQL